MLTMSAAILNYTGWIMATSLAHVYVNAYFEGGHTGADSGVFEIDLETMDGIKGSAKKGIKSARQAEGGSALR